MFFFFDYDMEIDFNEIDERKGMKCKFIPLNQKIKFYEKKVI